MTDRPLLIWRDLAALAGAPLLYLATGLVCAALARRRDALHASVAPLLGLVFWGALGMLHIVTRWPRPFFAAGAAVVLIAAAIFRRAALAEIFRDWRACQGVWWFSYALGLAIVTISPFPGLWLMGGDWLQHFGMTRAVHDGVFGAEHLARSPFFAVAALPVQDAVGDLAGFQIFNAVVLAAAWLPLVQRTIQEPATRFLRLAAWLALALSPFITIVQQNLWPKFFAGGLFCVALARIAQWKTRGRGNVPWSVGLWFAAAVLAHEATVFCAPVILALALSGPGRPERSALVRIGLALGLAAFVVAAWEGWTVWRFGFGARLASNPAVTFDSGAPLPLKMASNVLAMIVSTLPSDVAKKWTGGSAPFVESGYYTVVALTSWLGATLVGIGGPWWWGFRTSWRALTEMLWGTPGARGLTAATIAAVSLNVAVLGIPPGFGAIQTGLVPVAMWLFGAGIARVTAGDGAAVRRVLGGWLALGWLPYVSVSVVIGVMLNWPARFAAHVDRLRHVDGDLYSIFFERQIPLGMQPLPWLIGVAAGIALFVFAWRMRARMAAGASA